MVSPEAGQQLSVPQELAKSVRDIGQALKLQTPEAIEHRERTPRLALAALLVAYLGTQGHLVGAAGAIGWMAYEGWHLDPGNRNPGFFKKFKKKKA